MAVFDKRVLSTNSRTVLCQFHAKDRLKIQYKFEQCCKVTHITVMVVFTVDVNKEIIQKNTIPSQKTMFARK